MEFEFEYMMIKNYIYKQINQITCKIIQNQKLTEECSIQGTLPVKSNFQLVLQLDQSH